MWGNWLESSGSWYGSEVGPWKRDNECTIWGSHSITAEYQTFWDVMPCRPANSYYRVNYISADVALIPQKNWIFITNGHIPQKEKNFLNSGVLVWSSMALTLCVCVYLISFYTQSGLWVPESVRCWLWQWYEGWNFNFGNTPLDWIQELLEWCANAAGRMGPSPRYIHNGSGPSRNGHTQ